ncbi:hypothetical protein J7M28_12280, partial [bacterium]|nr:hypothetical protein [bacterium]
MRHWTAPYLLIYCLLIANSSAASGDELPARMSDPKTQQFSIETCSLLIEFDPEGSGIRRVLNKLTGLELFAKTGLGPGCALILDNGRIMMPSEPGQFTIKRVNGKIASLNYSFPSVASELVVGIATDEITGRVSFTPVLLSSPESRVASFVFPILSGMTRLGDSLDNDYLAHPSASGLLVRNPLETFRAGGVDHYQERFARSEYPDGFYGCPMQFMAFFDDIQGGFYFACHDPTDTVKELNFYLSPGMGYLKMHFTHYVGREVSRNGRPTGSFSYPIVFAATRAG